MNCCDDPKPRILEANGRVFCGTCRRYLDSRAETPSEPLSDDTELETGEPSTDQEGDPQ